MSRSRRSLPGRKAAPGENLCLSLKRDLPNLALLRTWPAAAVSGNIEAILGGANQETNCPGSFPGLSMRTELTAKNKGEYEMTRQPRRALWVLAALGALIVSGVTAVSGLSAGAAGSPSENDPALDRTRAQAKMLDDLFKVAVVDITNRYDGPPAAKVAKTIFAAAKEKQYFNARLLDVTGSPQNEANVPADDFEKRAAKAITQGKAYIEEVTGQGTSRRLRVATVVPAVLQKCAKCHGVKEGDLLGFLSYDLPVK